jgi:hypothetical protein
MKTQHGFLILALTLLAATSVNRQEDWRGNSALPAEKEDT